MPRVAWPCLLFVFASAVSLADPVYYRRGDDVLATFIASREALARTETEDAAALLDPTAPRLTPWQSAGPFFAPKGQSAFGLAFPPEQAVVLAEPMDNGRGKAISWTPRPDWVDGSVHNLPSGDYSATYLYRQITMPAAATLTVYLGSDDGFELFCNGQRVAGKDVPRGCSPNSDRVALNLNAGDNDILFKIVNITGGYAFYFSTNERAINQGAERRNGLWPLLRRDFPAEAQALEWERDAGVWEADWAPGEWRALAARYHAAAGLPAWQAQLADLTAATNDLAGLRAVRAAWLEDRSARAGREQLDSLNLAGVRAAIDDLAETFPADYRDAAEHHRALTAAEAEAVGHLTQAEAGAPGAAAAALTALEAVDTVRRRALLANPLLDFDRLLAVRRRGNIGLPANWQGNSSLRPTGYDNRLVTFPPRDPAAPATTLFQPEGGRFVGDLQLHWDATRMLLSMPDAQQRWQVWELAADGGQPTLVTPDEPGDVQNFDACYLPDGRILFCSTACYHGVPCVAGADKVSLIYLFDPADGSVRQLTFDQDHSWDPVVMNNGKVLFTRWEYSDTSHYFTRLLFQMNPDGTEQSEFYGSNSYWPNSMFYARPLPGEPNRVVTVVSGHHGERRAGELIVLDPSRGRREAEGVVFRIADSDDVVPVIEDQLVLKTWPKFLHPAPLSANYFVVACRPTARSNWGIYLADVFDNLVPLRVEPGADLLEPTPLVARTPPPVIPDRVDLTRTDATVYISDVYVGPGLAGVPRGTIKSLRLIEPHYTYPQMGGHIHVGVDGPWDVRRIIGTTPVEEDGSALFTVPANTPLAVQPLDEHGRAVQLMRSWMTAMPGETLSCVGCHEPQNTTPPARRTIAALQPPRPLLPWRGEPRGFSFRREVQPVLDANCTGCHDGTTARLDLRDDGQPGWRGFTKPYLALHPFVRRPGPESDYHLLPPGEFAADTSELIQMLAKGHHGVQLDSEALDRLITWIDLNVPCHGTWTEHQPIPGGFAERRRELRRRFAGITIDPEVLPAEPVTLAAPLPRAEPPAYQPVALAGWPLPAADAAAARAEREVALADGIALKLVRAPAGRFVMGTADGAPDEGPPHVVDIAAPFWIGATEVTCAQYAQFDPSHDSGYISETNKDQIRRGVPVNLPDQPVVRVSAEQAEAFCRWLTERTGLRFRLPDEAEWEYACRAGSDQPFHFGPLTADFAPFANLADRSLSGLALRDSPKWHPRVDSVNDGAKVTRPVGQGQPNAWGLHDMHGNAAEWTASDYVPYPGGRAAAGEAGRRVVRGGSWYDRPHRATATFRWGYPAWRQVYNVGFRVVTDGTPAPVAERQAAR